MGEMVTKASALVSLVLAFAPPFLAAGPAVFTAILDRAVGRLFGLASGTSTVLNGATPEVPRLKVSMVAVTRIVTSLPATAIITHPGSARAHFAVATSAAPN